MCDFTVLPEDEKILRKCNTCKTFRLTIPANANCTPVIPGGVMKELLRWGCLSLILLSLHALAAPRKPHVVLLGAVKKVAYSHAGDPAGARQGETELKIRPLIVDGQVKEWTTGESHDVTDRSFVVRRAIRLNDDLPAKTTPESKGESVENAHSAGANATGATTVPTGPSLKLSPKWVWQRGPWLMVDRATGHITALKLVDYQPGVSEIAWFRDYAAYCGVTTTGKSLYAVVAQISARKPVLAKKLSAFDGNEQGARVCEVPVWQREPLAVTFHPNGTGPVRYEIALGSAVLVEEAEEDQK